MIPAVRLPYLLRAGLGAFAIFYSVAAGARIEPIAGGTQTAAGAPASEVKLTEPFAVSFDSKGNWYICEYKGQRILRVNKDGSTTVVAGTGTAGFSGDGGPAVQAQLKDPHGIVITKDDQMYIADTLNHRVRRLNLKTGKIDTVAGTGEAGFSGDGGPAAKAQFNGTFGIDLSADERKLYVADLNNRRVRAIDLRSGIVSTVAGNGAAGVPADGAKAAESPLMDPRAVAADAKGNLYILERRGNALRVVDRDGKIRTLVGPGTVKPDMNGPKHLTVDRKGRVVIADAENHLIRRYDPATRQLTTIAGTGAKGNKVIAGDPLHSELNRPHGVTVDRNGVLYITDSYNHRILRLTE